MVGIARRSAAAAHLQAIITVTTPHGHQQRHSPHSPSPDRTGEKFETAVILLLFPKHAVGVVLAMGLLLLESVLLVERPRHALLPSTTTTSPSRPRLLPQLRLRSVVQRACARP